MKWLLEEAPDPGGVRVHVRYDSEYAANMAQGIWTLGANEELAQAVRELAQEVRQNRRITWEHVYGHTGAHDNELADRAADVGRRGFASARSGRWSAPPPA
eukprot:2208205-Pyramimonas_sp.AAC.1